MNKIELTTLIACQSGSDTVEETLLSLADCEIPDNYRMTIVVENGGPPVNQSMIESFEESLKLQYIHVPTKGKSNALNVALDWIEGGIVFFSDDDVRFDRDVLVAYQEAAEEYGSGHFFGGPFEVDQESPPSDWFRYYLPPSAKGCWYEDGSEINDSFTDFLGFNWAAYAPDLKFVGGFDTSKGPGSDTGSTGQETDMQRRLVEHGIKAQYVPEARVTHLVPRENCTPEWALRRSLRSGTKDGINYSEKNRHTSGLPPLWLIKANANKLSEMILHSLNKRKCYDAKFWLMYHIGFARGIWFNRS